MDILISNLLSELIYDFGKWSNWKYAYFQFDNLMVAESTTLKS